MGLCLNIQVGDVYYSTSLSAVILYFLVCKSEQMISELFTFGWKSHQELLGIFLHHLQAFNRIKNYYA